MDYKKVFYSSMYGSINRTKEELAAYEGTQILDIDILNRLYGRLAAVIMWSGQEPQWHLGSGRRCTALCATPRCVLNQAEASDYGSGLVKRN